VTSGTLTKDHDADNWSTTTLLLKYNRVGLAPNPLSQMFSHESCWVSWREVGTVPLKVSTTEDLSRKLSALSQDLSNSGNSSSFYTTKIIALYYALELT